MSIDALPESPRYAYGRRLIALLQSDPDIGQYVYPALYVAKTQNDDLALASEANEGVVVVVPGDVNASAATRNDRSIRAGWYDCEYIIACGIWQGVDLSVNGITPGDATDRLVANVIGLVQGMAEDGNSPACPVIVGDGELAIELAAKSIMHTRAVILSKLLSYETITLQPAP